MVDPNFATQQIAQGQRPHEQAIPSRFSPENMSFTSLFSTDLQGASGSPVHRGEPVPGSAFFTQLYGR
jgi:hypothetical protein